MRVPHCAFFALLPVVLATAPLQANDLFRAIDSTDAAQVKKLLDADPKLVLQKNPQGFTPLHLGATSRSVEIVKLLLDAGADINAKGDDDYTPLYLAACYGRKEVVALLLARGAEVDAVTKVDRFTPLHRAVQGGNGAIVTMLLAKGAAVDGGWNGKSLNPSITPLHFAAQEGQVEAARLLLAKGATVDATRIGFTSTPLYTAVERGEPEMVKLLLRKGANPNQKYVLARALQSGKQEMIQPFVARGADFKVQRELLLYAAISGKKDVVELALVNGGDVDGTENDGMTALFYASREGFTDIVRLLLAKGANPNLVFTDGTSPLHVASTKEIGELLLKHGAKADEADKRGLTPMLAAVLRDNKALAELLEAKGAKHTVETLAALGRAEELRLFLKKEAPPKSKNSERPSPLYLAAAFGQLEAAQVLLDAGADVNVARPSGETPLHAAAGHGHLALVELLVEHKAQVNAKMKLPSYNSRQIASYTPLMGALDKGHAEVVRFLAKAGGLPAIDGAKNAVALLPSAAAKKHLALMKVLFEEGAPLDTKLPPNNGSALHLAAAMGDREMVKWLVAKKLDVEMLDQQGWTPLLCAVPPGQTAVVEFLLSQGAKVNDNALFQAAENGHVAIVELLLAKGANRDAVSEYDEHTALGYAAAAGKLDVVKLLHAKGTSVKKDVGILHAAAFRGHREVVAFLLDQGVDVEEVRPDGFYLYYWAFHPRQLSILAFFAEKDPAMFKKGLKAGVTIEAINGDKPFGIIGGRPLQAAVAGKQKAIAALLLDKGASPKVLFPDGSTLLHLAGALDDEEMVELLLKHEVPMNTRNQQGQSALGIAVERAEEEVAALLRKHGAKE